MPGLTCGDRPTDAWLEAVSRRRSRRAYDGAPIAEDTLDALRIACEGFRPYEQVRAVLLTSVPEDLFRGFVGSYGRIRGARAALAFVGPVASRAAAAAIGYTGEGMVLEATSLGLDSCWVSGTFRSSVAERLADTGREEQVRAVAALGHAARGLSGEERLLFGQKSGRGKPRKPLEEIAPGSGAGWPEWAREGARSALLAPSAVNRQPWRIRYKDGFVVVSHEGADRERHPKRLDCGIAMLHFEIGARSTGVRGSWTLLEDVREVAEFHLETELS